MSLTCVEASVQKLTLQVSLLHDQQSQLLVANKDLESKSQALEQQADAMTSKSTSLERQLKDANERTLVLSP